MPTTVSCAPKKTKEKSGIGAQKGPLSLAAVLVCRAACSLLFMRPVCNSSALSARPGTLCAISMAPSAATATISSTDILPMHLQRPLLPPRPLRLHRCSLRTQAATLLCRSCSARPSSCCRSRACREGRSRSRQAPHSPQFVTGSIILRRRRTWQTSLV